MQSTSRPAGLRATGFCTRETFKDAVNNMILCLASLASLTFAISPILFLFWIMQPTVRANPGLSAYAEPPATRVEPGGRYREAEQRLELVLK
jgi:hypothetical protein